MTSGPARLPTRIVILCEGDTEEIAVKRFIQPRWERDGMGSVALHTINLHGKLEDIRVNLSGFRQDDRVIAVFTLIDLYGMNRVKHKPGDELSAKVQRVRNWLVDGFTGEDWEAFYHPHVSVHEVEAWLLADGRCIDPTVNPVQDAEKQDFQNPPKRRVDAILRRLRHGDGYREVRDASVMFKRARFEVVYHSCPYFRAFYDDLKEVAKAVLLA